MLNERFAISPLLLNPELIAPRGRMVDDGGAAAEGPLSMVVELDLFSGRQPQEVESLFRSRFARVVGDSADRQPYRIMSGFLQCTMTTSEATQLVVDDAQSDDGRVIFRIWPDYVLEAHTDRSCTTIKADASRRAYAATGANIVWAVLDTGIDEGHPHFADGTLHDPRVIDLHRDFTWIVRKEAPPTAPRRDSALVDESGHGTHVAGIIAGHAPTGSSTVIATLRPATGDSSVPEDQWPTWETRSPTPGSEMSGMAPMARLVSLKVLDAQTNPDRPSTTSSAVMAAVAYVLEVNAGGGALQIHGINLSLGCDWHPRDYAAGQSPLCRALNLLVATGVVVVVSAGNSGAEGLGDQSTHGIGASITEPGHADKVITVGACHRDRPHTFGVWFQSSKGPTLDGRRKPDLVAPGENISSAAAGKARSNVPDSVWQLDQATAAGLWPVPYVDDSGTSMAAPHVSGAVAAFLSVRQEFIGQADIVKQILRDTAVSLGRDAYFEGSGLIDVMAALGKV